MSLSFLHPYFTVAIIGLILFEMNSFNRDEPYIKNRYIWLIIAFLTVLCGFRNLAVDDFAYNAMYQQFGVFTSFSKEAMEANIYGVEWIYVLLGKIFFAVGLPFTFFVIFIACITIPVKYKFFESNSAYPALSFLIYMIPTYFQGDMTHMRQAVATALVFTSFWAIKKRNLPVFLGLIYLANGFHNSSIVFILAYFVAVIPVKKWMIITGVAICIVLSPFEVYSHFKLFDSIAPSDLMQNYTNYQSIVVEDTGKIRFTDFLTLFYLYFIVMYNNVAEQKIPYYEYMRNLTVCGICMYFIFRNSPIFSTRLVSYYLLFATVTIPSILAAIPSYNLRKYLHICVLCFVIFYYFLFASKGGKRAYSPDTYSSWLIGG